METVSTAVPAVEIHEFSPTLIPLDLPVTSEVSVPLPVNGMLLSFPIFLALANLSLDPAPHMTFPSLSSLDVEGSLPPAGGADVTTFEVVGAVSGILNDWDPSEATARDNPGLSTAKFERNSKIKAHGRGSLEAVVK